MWFVFVYSGPAWEPMPEKSCPLELLLSFRQIHAGYCAVDRLEVQTAWFVRSRLSCPALGSRLALERAALQEDSQNLKRDWPPVQVLIAWDEPPCAPDVRYSCARRPALSKYSP